MWEWYADSHGFSYTRKPPKRGASSNTVYWRCVVGNKDVQCPATVIQDANSFTRGKSNHLDSAQPGIANTVCIKKKVKSAALSDIFTSAAEITDKVLAENVTQEPTPALPAPINLAKAANHHRQCFHPKDPVHLDFELAEDFIPEGFFHKDIVVGDRHHLLFAADKILQLLSIAKNWFIDATFKVVKHPFTQLLSIHSFIKSGDTKKQVPLLFALMSGKCKRDYKKVFKAAINIISTIQVQTITIDFEAAMWQAIPKVLPTVHIYGCYFHWSQAVWSYQHYQPSPFQGYTSSKRKKVKKSYLFLILLFNANSTPRQ